jgi:hypothetical protein
MGEVVGYRFMGHDIMMQCDDKDRVCFLIACSVLTCVVRELSVPHALNPVLTPVMLLCIHMVHFLLFPTSVLPSTSYPSLPSPTHHHHALILACIKLASLPQTPKSSPSTNSPLLMFRILRTNNIHIPPLLPPHTLASITQLLDRTAHFHAAGLYPAAANPPRVHVQAVEP